MVINIERFHPDRKDLSLSRYEVDASIAKDMTIMDMLNYLSENLDQTLSYYSHSVCNHGICLRCIMTLNGKNVLACTTQVPELPEITIGPAKGKNVVKDLIVSS